MAEDGYLMQIYQGRKQQTRREDSFQSRNQDYGPIFDQYAALRKSKNPRANAFYSTHRKHLDEIVGRLSEETKNLENSSSNGDRKKAKKIRQKYGHLF